VSTKQRGKEKVKEKNISLQGEGGGNKYINEVK